MREKHLVMYKRFIVYHFALTIVLLPYSSGISLLLDGFGWDVWSPSAPNGDSFRLNNVSLPGDVYLSLFENGKIPDPYFSDNDVKLRWISYENWTYQRSVTLAPEIVAKQAVVVVADGLDTVAEVHVNDILVGSASNLFRTYVYNITSSVKQGENTLTISFTSPVNYSRDRALDHKRLYNYSVPLACPVSIQRGECHVNFVRKMASHFSWDWGPAFPTMGVTGSVKMEAFDTCFLKSFSVLPVGGKSSWNLHVELWLYCVGASAGDVELRVSNGELDLNYSWIDRVNHSGINRFYKRLELPKNAKVEVWWPNGLGNQKLYEVTGEFKSSNEAGRKTLLIGFRRVQLVQDSIPNFENGSTFYVRINDVPTFLKGSNWIPGDSFLSRLTEDRLLFYFESMREANMNCIRVWGGGVYETENFYELADRYGIMIWQDMMFAVNLYPATADFLNNVEAEIDDQINRLKHHASIIIWAGNNENELGIVTGWYPMDAPYDVYKRDYLALYNSTIYSVINRTDFYSRPFVFSSPSDGIRTVVEGGVSKNPGDPKYGDVHTYSYDGDAWDWKRYPIARCVTEFGFQSYPSLETFSTALLDVDLRMLSRQMLHRQHHPAGEFQMLAQMVRQFKFFGAGSPSAAKKLMPPFRDVIYFSQIHQAMAYKTEVEHYRRWRSTINDQGEGLTMCALYWQLNDIWQAPTWSSIDYGLKWKMAHYYAKRFFAAVLVSPYIDGENLKITVVNDFNTDIENATVVVDTLLWDKFTPMYQKNISLKSVKRNSAALIYDSTIGTLLHLFGGETLFILFNVRVLDGRGQQLGPNNVIIPDKFHHIPTDSFGKVAVLDVWPDEQAKRVYGIKLVASKVSPFVWLDVEGVQGYFSDNGFTMVTKEYTIFFTAWNEVSLEQITKNLTVKTLGDLYRNGTFASEQRPM